MHEIHSHDLKIWPEHFEAVMTGLKKVELRLDDRGFAAGDELVLREWDRFGRFYTGRQASRKVAHVGRGLGLMPGYVALSLEDPDAARRGAFFHQLAEALGVQPIFGAVEEERLLDAAVKATQVVKAYESIWDASTCLLEDLGGL